MLLFFRKIRWRLARDNQFFKYSRYAVGEVILVVIGILLALQVNNWNTKRLESIREQEMLVRILKDVHLELDIYTFHRQQIPKRISYFDSVVSGTASDKQLEKFVTEICISFSLEESNSTYFGLKESQELHLISNDSLYKTIVYHYEIMNDYLKEYSDWHNQFVVNTVEDYMVKNVKYLGGFKNDPEQLRSQLNDLPLVSIINFQKDSWQQVLPILDENIENTKNLKEMIENEIPKK